MLQQMQSFLRPIGTGELNVRVDPSQIFRFGRQPLP